VRASPYLRSLPLTEIRLEQIQRCIREWGLVQPQAVNQTATSPSPTLSDDWPSPPRSELPAQATYTLSDPAQISKYAEKPLPSIPIPRIHQNASKIQKRRLSSRTDLLKVTCYHGPSASDEHEVQTPLESIPEGPSPIMTFVKDHQSHERIALGLENTPVESDSEENTLENIEQMRIWQRAKHLKTDRPRQEKRPRQVLKGDAINRSGSGSNSIGKRKPQWKEDEPERKDRKKTPPSPCDSA
jgi:hypothetical protein